MGGYLLGRTPRLTAYFCGLSIGLALLSIGVNEIRLLAVGELSPPSSVLYGAFALAVGLTLSFVFGYLNGGLLASWTAGIVPAAGRVSGELFSGSLRGVGAELLGAAGIGVFVGAVGFTFAVEKHRLDGRTSELPPAPSRPDLFVGIVLSIVVGGLLLSVSTFVGG